MNISLERVKRTDTIYQDIRDRHYVANHGCIGRQLHYIIKNNNKPVGIISGASAVWACKPRDEFFKINKDNRRELINKVISNVVFRLEKSEHNMASHILSKWRKLIVKEWKEKYNDSVIGFETFIFGENRIGTCYKADGWTFVGMTKGNTKFHPHGAYKETIRLATDKKFIYCKKLKETW